MKKILTLIIAVIAMISSTTAVWAENISTSSSNSDTDKTAGTYGIETDSTELKMYMNEFWYGQSSVTSKGTVTTKYNAKGTGYTQNFKSLVLKTHMNGFKMNCSISSSTGVSVSNPSVSDSVSTITCDTPNLSYKIKTTSRMWTEKYWQTATATYQLVKNSKAKYTIVLETEINY